MLAVTENDLFKHGRRRTVGQCDLARIVDVIDVACRRGSADPAVRRSIAPARASRAASTCYFSASVQKSDSSSLTFSGCSAATSFGLGEILVDVVELPLRVSGSNSPRTGAQGTKLRLDAIQPS